MELRMSDEPKQETNLLPLILVGVVLFFALRQPREGGEQSDTGRVETVVKSTFPSIRSAYRDAFIEAAKKIESGEIKNQEQWTKWIADNAGAKQREALDKVYTAIDELKLPADFAGKEKEIAEVNRRIGGAW
jgi:hypothetical protein